MSWTTQDELQFIRGLGYHRNYSALLSDEDRIRDLKLYRMGLMRRTAWGDLNRAEILSYVDDRIHHLLSTQSSNKGDKT